MNELPSFLGRKKKVTKRMVELDRFYYDTRMFNAIIYGTPRSGKSVLLMNLLNIFHGLGYNCVVNDCAKGFDLKTGKPKSEILGWFSDVLEHINKKYAYLFQRDVT